MKTLCPYIIGLFLVTISLSAEEVDVNMQTQIADDNNLIITYDLPPLPEGKIYERVTVVAVIDNVNFYPADEFISGDVGTDISPGKNKTIRWDITKEIPLEKLEDFNVELNVFKGEQSFSGLSKIDPFTVKDKIPHYLGGAIGLGIVGTGFYMGLERQELEENLTKYPQASSVYWDDYEGGRAGAIEDRNQFTTFATIALIGGVGIIVTDFLIYKRRQKLSKEFKDLTTFYPVIHPEGSLGLGLSIRF